MQLLVDGQDLCEKWLATGAFIRAEVVGANVSLSFTGVLSRFSTVEIVLARNSDELSISTFFGSYQVFEPHEGADSGSWGRYVRVVQITTDGGAQCHLYELREEQGD